MKAFLGISFWRFQLLILAVAFSVSDLFQIIQGTADLLLGVFSSLITGNCTFYLLEVTSPLCARKASSLDWFVYLAILLPVAAISSLVSSMPGSCCTEADSPDCYRLTGWTFGLVRWRR